jgi:hypothetical protein
MAILDLNGYAGILSALLAVTAALTRGKFFLRTPRSKQQASLRIGKYLSERMIP